MEWLRRIVKDSKMETGKLFDRNTPLILPRLHLNEIWRGKDLRATFRQYLGSL